MQIHFHHPHLEEPHLHRPIFYRLKERSLPPSPISVGRSGDLEAADIEDVWEKRFIKCSYAMVNRTFLILETFWRYCEHPEVSADRQFLDHYSYSALSYFLLIKAVITLFSTIAVLALLPISLTGIITLPIYLRGMRRWGRWQAGIALENL
jgi:hypothetical protein